MREELLRLRDESKDIPEPCPFIDKIQYLLEMQEEGQDICYIDLNSNLEEVRNICDALIKSNAALYQFAKTIVKE